MVAPVCSDEAAYTIAEFARPFGKNEFPRALFYQFELALRFELGGDLNYREDRIPRFLQALDRARSVLSALFDPARPPTVFISLYDLRDSIDRKWMRRLRSVGFDTRMLHYLGGVKQESEDFAPLYRHWYVAGRITAMDINKLAWCSLAEEIGIRPRGAGNIYFVDQDRRAIAHIYDDRGMDAVAMEREVLLPLY